MYAIVRTGGKQYRVEEGRSVDVELLPAEEGSAVELDDVLMIEDGGKVTVGAPTIEGARVLTTVEAHSRAKKIVVFKYRAKVRTRKKTGHRQHFTRLAVTEILAPGQDSKAAKPKRTRKAAAKADDAKDEADSTAAKPAATKASTSKKAPAKKPAAKKTAAKPKAAKADDEKKPPRRRAAKPKAADKDSEK